MLTQPPFMDGLIINIHSWLWQKARKALMNTELNRSFPAIRCPARRPKVENCAFIF